MSLNFHRLDFDTVEKIFSALVRDIIYCVIKPADKLFSTVCTDFGNVRSVFNYVIT